jgi:DNA-binding Xre family transcriptional regulator
MTKRLQFRIAELIAAKSRREKRPITYETITAETGISANSLSNLKQGNAKMVGFSTIERLLDFFGCTVGELIVYE